MRAGIRAGIMAAVLMTVASAQAAEPPLTDDQIKGVLTCWGEMAPIIKKYKGDPAEQQRWESIRAGQDKAAECVATPEVKATATYKEVLPILTKNGFADFTDWCKAQSRVFKAYFALRMEREAPNLAEQMATARQQIEAAPDLSAEQKKQMLDRMSQSLTALQAPEADKKAITPHVPQLDEITAELTKGAGAPPK